MFGGSSSAPSGASDPLEHKVRGGSSLTNALSKASPLSSSEGSAASTDDAAAMLAAHDAGGRLSGASDGGGSSGSGSGRHASARFTSKLSFRSCFSPMSGEGAWAACRERGGRTGRAALQAVHAARLTASPPPRLTTCPRTSGVAADDSGGEELQSPVMAADVGIRPSFYWLDSPASEEERLLAEQSARWMKSDCQDDALVIRGFGGQPWQTFAGEWGGEGRPGGVCLGRVRRGERGASVFGDGAGYGPGGAGVRIGCGRYC